MLDATIKLYNGYGHEHDLIIYGHVFKRKANGVYRENSGMWSTAINLVRQFMIKPYPAVELKLKFRDQEIKTVSQKDGFFKFEWSSTTDVDAGWHNVEVLAVAEDGQIFASASGKVFVPALTQYSFISDVDDTVLVSHSATTFRRMRELLIKNPAKRKLFKESAKWYKELALSSTNNDAPNPFFYVSSSEWNLYDNLDLIFKRNQLPEGIFLLSHLKRLRELPLSGKKNHHSKQEKIERILGVFPKQIFILTGDNSQRDPMIYASIVKSYPNRIKAVYIRNIRKSKRSFTQDVLTQIEQMGPQVCFFEHNTEAMRHGRSIGLLS